jgi:hypothetical protein
MLFRDHPERAIRFTPYKKRVLGSSPSTQSAGFISSIMFKQGGLISGALCPVRSSLSGIVGATPAQYKKRESLQSLTANATKWGRVRIV